MSTLHLSYGNRLRPARTDKNKDSELCLFLSQIKQTCSTNSLLINKQKNRFVNCKEATATEVTSCGTFHAAITAGDARWNRVLETLDNQCGTKISGCEKRYCCMICWCRTFNRLLSLLFLFMPSCEWHRGVFTSYNGAAPWNGSVQIWSELRLKPPPYVVCVRFSKN